MCQFDFGLTEEPKSNAPSYCWYGKTAHEGVETDKHYKVIIIGLSIKSLKYVLIYGCKALSVCCNRRAGFHFIHDLLFLYQFSLDFANVCNLDLCSGNDSNLELHQLIV